MSRKIKDDNLHHSFGSGIATKTIDAREGSGDRSPCPFTDTPEFLNEGVAIQLQALKFMAAPNSSQFTMRDCSRQSQRSAVGMRGTPLPLGYQHDLHKDRRGWRCQEPKKHRGVSDKEKCIEAVSEGHSGHRLQCPLVDTPESLNDPVLSMGVAIRQQALQQRALDCNTALSKDCERLLIPTQRRPRPLLFPRFHCEKGPPIATRSSVESSMRPAATTILVTLADGWGRKMLAR